MSEFSDPIEQLFYEQLVWRFMPEFTRAAEALGVTNEDLLKAVEEHRASEGMGAAFAFLCSNVVSHRRIGALCALIRPGELKQGVGGISLLDLVEREARLKGDA